MSANAESHGPGVSYMAEGTTMPTASAGMQGAAEEPTTITRRIHVKIQGSMADFAQDGQGCATWRCVDGKQAAIWGIQDLALDSATHESSFQALGNAVVRQAVLLEHKSTFQVPLGMSINCLPAQETTGFGEAYCYTVLPESNSAVPLKLYEALDEEEQSLQWRKAYPKYNSTNLEKYGVLETTDCVYLFVHENHPAVGVLRANKDLLGCEIDSQQKIDNEWYKIQKDTFHTCCSTIRSRVLSKMPTRNLNDFSLEIHRIGTNDWLDLQDGDDALASFKAPPGSTAEEIEHLEAKHLEEFCEKKCSYHARLEVTFEIQN